MTYQFYIIYSSSLNKFYTGHSNNIEERLRKHNTIHKGYTGKADDWKLVYHETFETKQEAYLRERQIKNWKSRKLIEELIERFRASRL